MKTTTKKQPGKAKGGMTKEQGDKIVSSKAANAQDATKHVVTAADGRSVIMPTERWSGELRTLSGVGKSMTAFQAAWAKASKVALAKGVTGRDAPHSAKAIADNKAKASAAKKPAEKKAAKKAEKAKQGENRSYAALVKLTDLAARVGTKRHTMLSCILTNKTTDAAKACIAKAGHAAEAQAFINWAAKSAYIKYANN
jgi:hypothetical protein